MKRLNFLLLFVFVGTITAQESLDALKLFVYPGRNDYVMQNYIRLLNEMEQPNSDMKEFRFDEWQSAKVVSNEDEIVQLDSVNFHINDETMFFMREGNMYFLYPDKVKMVSFEDEIFVPFKSDLDKNHPFKFFEVLIDGDLTLLKDYKVDKVKVNNHPMGIESGVTKYKTVEKSKLYYHYKGSKPIHEVPKNKNKFLKIFKRNKVQMLEFAKSENISTREESDIQYAFQFYNELNQGF